MKSTTCEVSYLEQIAEANLSLTRQAEKRQLLVRITGADTHAESFDVCCWQKLPVAPTGRFRTKAEVAAVVAHTDMIAWPLASVTGRRQERLLSSLGDDDAQSFLCVQHQGFLI
jgi:hypothetical protein